MPEPHHFSDYGFDPQIDFFQFLEEARKHKRETVRSVDSLHFKLQKPISKDDSNRKIHKTKKKRWWRKAFLFFKWKWIYGHHNNDLSDEEDVHKARARAFRASVSGPVYITESISGSSTPHRTTNRPSSGPLAGNLTTERRGDLEIPYLSLRELNREQQQQRMSTSAMPIYLVT
ncbi:hypothetical protein P3X46_005932 [Hevea brasiliensis]|uniref:Uncharacterized protein n=2 Tax=Hevea brasiliensis TaxID=3981 RepID=A0A6A6KJM0_HEVBR|nr:uncharacterized protein LOC110633021 [Hevea brasiliensis]KAF2289151.1 hypothetical protein GH714_029127 [Hevea brasiliensis]KAJ9181886.1 hypothetical protein P3X46_005932 [Hevea brasiliensis]